MKPEVRSNERTALDAIVFTLRRLTPSEHVRVWQRLTIAVEEIDAVATEEIGVELALRSLEKQ